MTERINPNPNEATIVKKIFQSSDPSTMKYFLPFQFCICDKLHFFKFNCVSNDPLLIVVKFSPYFYQDLINFTTFSSL